MYETKSFFACLLLVSAILLHCEGGFIWGDVYRNRTGGEFILGRFEFFSAVFLRGDFDFIFATWLMFILKSPMAHFDFDKFY
jgi:hypothetical protein